MALRIYLDSNRRNWAWSDQPLGFREWGQDIAAAGGTVFLLLHTRDIRYPSDEKVPVRGIRADDTTEHFDDTAEKFEERVRAAHGPATAILYISGHDDPWQHLHPLPRPTGAWSHVHMRSVLESDPVGFAEFGARLAGLVQRWENANGERPPEWGLLKRDWLWEISDVLSGALLEGSDGEGCVRDDTRQQIQELLSGPGVESELQRLSDAGCKDELRGVKSLANQLLASLDPGTEFRNYLDSASRKLACGIWEQPEQDGSAARREFMRLRGQVNHDHFQNTLLGGLGSGWGKDDRLTERDAVLQAIRGDERSASHLRQVLLVWSAEGSPELARLLDLGGRLVAPGIPRGVVETTSVADATIRSLFTELMQRRITPEAQAEAFWEACETIARLLSSTPEQLEAYLGWRL